MRDPLDKMMKVAIPVALVVAIVIAVIAVTRVETAQAGDFDRTQKIDYVGSAKVPVDYFVHRPKLLEIKEAAKAQNKPLFCSVTRLDVCVYEGELYLWAGDETPAVPGENGEFVIEVRSNGDLVPYLRGDTVFYDDAGWRSAPERGIKFKDIALVSYVTTDEQPKK